MTLASHRSPSPDSHGSADAQPVSDFHLVEGADGWRLTINASQRLRDLLDGTAGDGSTGAGAESFTVHVEPNLLPGEPFPVTIKPSADDA